MALPFSNTTLRIPRGFGNLLEGLAKEVLRDQPEDIPVFAALYFSKLLKAREESGLDPAEWGARLEDRYYNNHAFKETTNDEGSGSLEEKRNKADHADPFESNGPQLSVLNETSTDFAGNIDVEQDHTLERSLDLESGETELRPAGNIPDAGTADVDVCAEELNNPAEAPEQTAEMTEIPNEVSEEYTDADICTSELDLKLQPTCGGLAEIEHLEVDGPPETPERKAESPFLVEEESESQDMPCIDNDQVVGEENVDDHTDLETTGTSLQTTGLEDDDTIQDHAEESAESENEGENDRETDNPNSLLVEEEESESQDMSCIDNDQVVDDTSKENVDDHTEDLETTGTSLQTTGLEEDDTMQDHAEESAESENEGENDRETDSPNYFLVEEEESESQDMSCIHYDQVVDDTLKENVEDHTEDLETTATSLQTTGLEEDDTMQDHVEESSESENEGENEIKETNKSATAEAGEKAEGNGNLRHMEEQEESDHQNDSSNTVGQDESRSNSRSLLEIKEDYSETYDSKSEVIDVLDEVYNQSSSNTHEDSIVDQSSSVKVDDELSGSDGPNPCIEKNDSDTEITEEPTNKEISLTDAIDTSEKDLNTEDEGSDLESDLDILNLRDAVKSNEESDETHEIQLKEGILLPETEDVDHTPLSAEEAEVITEQHPAESQEHTENAETEADQEDQLESQRDKSQESALESEKQELSESQKSKEKCSEPQEEEDIMDIPLDDPEANKAAAKIQAGFRGHMTRKKMKPDEKPGEEVSSSGEGLNGNQVNSAGGADGETDATSGPEQ